MKIGLDVAQTCAERAGCAWSAAATASALIEHVGTHEFLLYHHFGNWCNPQTSGGFRSENPQVFEPMRNLSEQEARSVWRSVTSGATLLPGTPDIVHSFSFQAPKLQRSKLVFTVHDVAFWTHPHFATEENRLVCQRGLLEALQHADALHFPTEYTRSEFNRILGGWLERSGIPWAVIPWGSRFPVSLTHKEVHRDSWLFVGSLEPRKNISAVLDAFELYQKQGGATPLLLAGGEGWKSDDLKRRISKMESEGGIRRLGYVTEDELRDLYSRARALIFPSWCEGFGLPMIEAMSQGAPLFASNLSCMPEVGGSAALYFSPSKPEELAHLMLQLDGNRELAEKLGQRSRQQAAAFSWQRTAQQLAQFYERILEEA